MSKPRLYCPSLVEGHNALAHEETHHAYNSLRIKLGDELTLFDGRGTEGCGRVTNIGSKQVHVDVFRTAKYEFDVAVKVTLAVAMPRTHRQGYLVEKCTELGVAAIWPIRTERSVTKPGSVAVEKWQRRAIEAAKQSGRRWIPHIEPTQSFDEGLARRAEFDHVALAHTGGETIPVAKWLGLVKPQARVLAFIGPEGGWSDEECARACDVGLSLVCLAPTVLRAETAAVAFCATATAMGV